MTKSPANSRIRVLQHPMRPDAAASKEKRHESQGISKEDLREVQDYQKKTQDCGDLREPEA
jgi:hypothetical protein